MCHCDNSFRFRHLISSKTLLELYQMMLKYFQTVFSELNTKHEERRSYHIYLARLSWFWAQEVSLIQ